MAQPSVEYPPWLTPIPSVITDAAGAPVETATSVSYIPPIYWGPSIPLGSLYSYGGYSYPPSIELPGGSTATIPSPTGTAITTSATPTTISTTSATPSSSVLTSAIPSSTSLTSSSTSASSSSSFTPSASSSSSSAISSASSSSASPTSTASGITEATGLTKAQLVGVIVASILGLVFLFVLALFLFLWWKARKNRREYRTLSPIDDDYIIVPSGGRVPGEGSPRQSGEETDSFLRRSQGAALGQTSGDLPSRPYTARVPPPTTNSNSSDSTNSHASGFGVLLERPTIQFMPTMPEYEQHTGQQLSEAEMERLGRENVIPEDNAQYQDPEYSGAFAYSDVPPPRLVDPAAAPLLGVTQLGHQVEDSGESKGSLSNEHPEEATIHTAVRVKAEDLGSRTNSQDETMAGPSRRSSAGALLSAIGLGALANLGRRSWFRNFDSPLPTHHEPETPSYLAEPLTEKDLESGQQTLLNPNQRAADSFGNRPRGAAAGIGTDGSRPISSISARSAGSGGTQFYDARSRPGTPGTPILTPLPRALTPVEQPLPALPTPEHVWISSPLAGPPAYEEPMRPYATHSPARSQTSLLAPSNDVDILDMPAPNALNNFASISSLKETPTGSSFGTKAAPFPPPGLTGFAALDPTIRPVGWASSDTGTEASDSRAGSFGYSSGRVAVHELPFDILEEAPPEAEQGWRTITGGGFGDSHRGTFGTLVQGHDLASEQGSLHSMRSHLNASNRSSGSAAASHILSGSVGSNSSRSNRSANSNIHALMHKGSVSSDSRKKHPPVSPALSAFGVHPRGRSTPSPGPSAGPSALQHQLPFDRPHTPPTIIGSPAPVHMSPEKPRTIKSSVGSTGTTVAQGDTSMSTVKGVGIPAMPELDVPERSASASPPLSGLGVAPWATGLDRDWRPTP